MEITAVILAAGQGTRMRSTLPKVLHPLAGRPLIDYSLSLARAVGSGTPVVVIGHGAEQVRQVVGDAARFVVQEPQLGTAHAVQQAEPLLARKPGLVLVISADMPLFTEQTLQSLVQAQQQNSGPVTMLTMILADSHGFGRIVRAADGSVQAIVEEAQCTPDQLKIQELNVGAYCFDGAWLWDALRRVPLSPKGEYYLTDVIGIAVSEGKKVQALTVKDSSEAIGINTRVHLSEAEAIMRRRINAAWMNFGVTMIDPENTYIDASVQIGRDTIIFPGTHLRGSTVIGENCQIGPDAVIYSSYVGSKCKVYLSYLENDRVEDGMVVGPYQNPSPG